MAISNTNRGEGGLISYEKSRRFFIRKGISLGDRTQGIKNIYLASKQMPQKLTLIVPKAQSMQLFHENPM